MLTLNSNKKIWKMAFLPILDFLALFFSAILVYQIRYSWFNDNFSLYSGQDLPFLSYLGYTFILSLICILIYSFLGLYSLEKIGSPLKTLFNLSAGIFFIIFSLVIFLFFYEHDKSTLPQGVPISRFILATGGFFALYLVVMARSFLWLIEFLLLKIGVGMTKIIFVGDPEDEAFVWLKERKDVKKIFHFNELNEETVQKVEELLDEGNVEGIYVVSFQSELGGNLAMLAELHNIDFVFYPKVFDKYTFFGMKAVNIGKNVYLKLMHSNLDGWWIVIKRLFDFAFALGFLIFFSPLLILISILIKLDSKGPVFYLSERVGPNGKVFKLFKFRRLKQEFCVSEEDPEAKKALEYEAKLIEEKNERPGDVLYKIKDDPRQTRVGGILEKTSLDELPQFINVLLGNLSVVGPRPHQPREVAKYSSNHYKVLNIKPGITGLAQINGRSEISFEDEVKMDIYYVENWSLFLDIWIIIKTPFTILLRALKK